MDEQALQAAFSAGDDACLSAAIALYGQPLLRYCHHILCDYHEAQDAVQATFIKAWSHRAGFRGGSLQAWLFRMAYTTSIDLLRRRKRQLFAPPPQPPASDPDYIGAELRGRVMEELSFDELAERHGIGAPTLRKRYERARKKLAAALTRSGKECTQYEAE